MAKFLLYKSLIDHNLPVKVIAGNVYQDLNLCWTRVMVECETKEEAMEIFLKWYLDERDDPECPFNVEDFPYLSDRYTGKLVSPSTLKKSYMFLEKHEIRAIANINGRREVEMIDIMFTCIPYIMKDGHQICGYFSKLATKRIRMDGSY